MGDEHRLGAERNVAARVGNRMGERPEWMDQLERGGLGRWLGTGAPTMDLTDGRTGPEDRTVAISVKLETLLVGEREIRVNSRR